MTKNDWTSNQNKIKIPKACWCIDLIVREEINLVDSKKMNDVTLLLTKSSRFKLIKSSRNNYFDKIHKFSAFISYHFIRYMTFPFMTMQWNIVCSMIVQLATLKCFAPFEISNITPRGFLKYCSLAKL